MGRPPTGATHPQLAGRLDSCSRRAPDSGAAAAGASRRRHPRRVPRRGGHRDSQRPGRPCRGSDPTAVHSPERISRRSGAGCGRPLDRRRRGRQLDRGRHVRLGPRGCTSRRCGDARIPDRPRRQQRRHVLVARDRADGSTLGRAGAHRQARHRLRRDRRPCLPGAPARASRRPRPGDGTLARCGHAPTRRMGDRSLVPDRRKSGRDSARFQRRHPRVPVGREGDRNADDMLGARRLQGDRTPPHERLGLTRPRRDEPRESPFRRRRRGDPHGEQDQGRTEGESRLPSIPLERTQRDPCRGALHR